MTSPTGSRVRLKSPAAFSMRLRRSSALKVEPVAACTAALRYETVTPQRAASSVRFATR